MRRLTYPSIISIALLIQLSGCKSPQNEKDTALQYNANSTFNDDISSQDSAISSELSIKDLVTLYQTQHSTEKQQEIESLLIKTANKQRYTFDQKKDEQGTLAMYQYLVNTVPNITRFKIELAQSYLRQGDKQEATQILSAIQDPKYTELAKYNLLLINKR